MISRRWAELPGASDSKSTGAFTIEPDDDAAVAGRTCVFCRLIAALAKSCFPVASDWLA